MCCSVQCSAVPCSAVHRKENDIMMGIEIEIE